jgi:hypothetical protein
MYADMQAKQVPIRPPAAQAATRVAARIPAGLRVPADDDVVDAEVKEVKKG